MPDIDKLIALGNFRFDLKEHQLYLAKYEIHMQPPGTFNGYDLVWTQADLVLYHIRDGVREIADVDKLIEPQEHESGIQAYSFTFFPNGPYPIPEVQEGDRFELVFLAAVENGVSLEETVVSWTYTGGEFRQGS